MITVLSELAPPERARRHLEWALDAYRGKIVLACSFGGPSGMVVLDLALEIDRTLPVFFLDTGLLFPQTYALVDEVQERYGITVRAVKPEPAVLLDTSVGPALWSREPDRCCAIRKVEPQRAFLRSYDAWISGIRRDQSPTRSNVLPIDYDERAGLVKVSPLADWSEDDVWNHVRAHDLPYNALHDDGYPSIGCAPCTRRPEPGADARSGRWAGFAKTECGIHGP